MIQDDAKTPIIQCAYQLVLELHQLLSRFPKHHRYQLGDRLGQMTLDFFQATMKANFTRDLRQRSVMLEQLSGDLFQVRMMMRMGHDLKILSKGQWTAFNTRIEDIRTQLIGWSHWVNSQIPPNQPHKDKVPPIPQN